MADDDDLQAGVEEASLGRAFEGVGYWMGIVGRVTVMFAFFLNALMLISGFALATVITSVLLLWVGAVTLNAAAAFRRVDIEAPDVARQIGDAVLNLRDLFRLLALIIALESVLIMAIVILPRL